MKDQIAQTLHRTLKRLYVSYALHIVRERLFKLGHTLLGLPAEGPFVLSPSKGVPK